MREGQAVIGLMLDLAREGVPFDDMARALRALRRPTAYLRCKVGGCLGRVRRDNKHGYCRTHRGQLLDHGRSTSTTPPPAPSESRPAPLPADGRPRVELSPEERARLAQSRSLPASGFAGWGTR